MSSTSGTAALQGVLPSSWKPALGICAMAYPLSSYFCQDGTSKRGGVPQFTQPHVMLVGGMQHCEELFPQFQERLLAAGGQAVDWLRDCCVVCCF